MNKNYHPSIPNLKGKVGDYQCNLNPDNANECVGYQNTYDKKTCDMVNDHKNTYPLVPIKDPSNFFGCSNGLCGDKTQQHTKGIRINGVPFQECSDDSSHCIDKLNINSPTYTGLAPGYYSSTTPPTNNFLLKKLYTEYKGTKLNKNKKYTKEMPFFDPSLFNLSQCRRWCTSEPTCKGFSYITEPSNNCIYTTADTTEHKKTYPNADTYFKNKDSYIHNMSEEQENEMYKANKIISNGEECSEFDNLSQFGKSSYISYISSGDHISGRTRCRKNTDSLGSYFIQQLPNFERFSNKRPKFISLLLSSLILYLIYVLIKRKN